MLENKLYDMNIKCSYELVNNTNCLDNMSIDDVLDIKFSCYQDVILLLSNGNVIVNGQERYNNIKSLAFVSGLVMIMKLLLWLEVIAILDLCVIIVISIRKLLLLL